MGIYVAGIHRIVVHVHADELLGQRLFHVARELHGVVQRFFVIVQRVLDAVAHQAAAFALNVRIERSQQRIGAERQRQIVASSSTTCPDRQRCGTAFAVSQLRLMDDEAGIDGVLSDGVRDLVEGHRRRLRNPVR